MMLRLLTPAVLCLALPAVLAGQGAPAQANNWHFSAGLYVQFQNGAPVLSLDSAMEGVEGVVSYSDTTGQLLFYTNGGGRPPATSGQNGGTIWNRNNEVMYDMMGTQGGGFSARQSSIAMPDPAGEPGVHYLFTMDEVEFDVGGSVPGQPLGRGLSYFVIDMNLNGGLGGVRDYVEAVYTPAYEGLDATPMADGSGYWLVCHAGDAADPALVVLPFTAAGVGAPLTYAVPDVAGRIKFSPDGAYLLNDARLYDFDNATGVPDVAGLRLLAGISTQSSSFTPDGRFLYALEERPALGEIIARYDLDEPTTPPLAVEILAPDATELVLVNGNFQLAPNGNIYFVEQRLSLATGGVSYGLSEIACITAPAPVVNRLIIDLPDQSDLGFLPQTLPQFVDAIFVGTTTEEDTVRLEAGLALGCGDDPVRLEPRVTGFAYAWSTGDTSRTIVVTTPGTYCVSVATDCGVTVDCQEVVYESRELTATAVRDDDLGCDGVRTVYRAGAAGELTELMATLTDGTTGEVLATVTVTGADTISVPRDLTGRPTRLTLSATTANCDGLTTTLDLPAATDDRFRPLLTRVSDAEPCNGQALTLEVTDGPGATLALAGVRWDDGETANPRTLTADNTAPPGVTAFSVCGDSVRLTFTETIAEFCDCRDGVPELVTPNGDGTNDFFGLYSNCPAQDFTLLVYNRWGQPVYSATDAARRWDGTKDGTAQDPGVYLYRMTFRYPDQDGVETREGQFTLVR